jgi:hypothetical protein
MLGQPAILISKIMKRMIQILMVLVIRLSKRIKNYKDFLRNLNKKKKDPYFKRKMITSLFCRNFQI